MKTQRFLSALFTLAIFILFQSCDQQQQSGNLPSQTKEITGSKQKTTAPDAILQDNRSVESEEPVGEAEITFTHDLSEDLVYKDMESHARSTDEAVEYADYAASPVGASYASEKKALSTTKFSPRGEASGISKVNSNLAGKLTAGEINDFQKWKLWNDLSDKELKAYAELWKLKPENRYSVLVQTRSGNPLADCAVQLIGKDGAILWKSRTDNTGKAELWAGVSSASNDAKAESIQVTYMNKQYEMDRPKKFERGINTLKIKTSCSILEEADILFTVDATGSMGDEINYLQAELLDIIKKVKQQQAVKINLGSVFYRDHGDAYVTRKSAFSKDFSVTNEFIADQSANGGGDGPEAVDDAMQVSINNMEWSQSARARLMFLILDAPPHTTQANINKINAAVKKAAEKGIRMIPLVASGGGYESDKSMEYLMRSCALATNGTYAFLTNHSGIGNPHTAPSTDSYKVETLNDLLLRLINQYLYMPSCEEDEFLEEQENLQDTSQVQVELPKNPIKPELPSLAILKAYPNPAREVVNVEASSTMTELLLTDNSGKILERFLPKASFQRIELYNYPSGIYFIKAKVEEKWLTARIVVSH